MRANGGRPVERVEAAVWFLRFFRDPIKTMREVYRVHGPVSAVGDIVPRPGRRPRLHAFAFGPRFNEQILGHPDRFRNTGQTLRGPRESAQRRIRYGLTRMTGKKHRDQRKLILPALQRGAVESYHPQMTAIVEEFLRGWHDGQRLDLWRTMRQLSLQLSSRILFGVQDPERATRLARMIEGWGRRNFSRGVWLLPVPLPGTPYRALLDHAVRLEEEILALIDEKRRARGPTRDALSRLVHAFDEEAGRMSNADLVGQTTILFGASYETMVNAITWTLFLLALHPEVLHDVTGELEAKLGGDAPSFAQLDKLPLLDAVIKESMRLLPPVPFGIRATMHGARLGHLDLRDGDRVIFSHFITHHMPEIYPDPERFLPQRWFSIRPTQYEYLPFSAGPRLCVGYIFANVAMKTILAPILQQWRIEIESGARVDPAVRVTLAPRWGLPAILHRQDHDFQASPVTGSIHAMVVLEA